MLPDKPVTPRLFLLWIAEQFHGIATGLRSIHDVRVQALRKSNVIIIPDFDDEINDYYGIHGDLKPENILHFSQLPESTGLGVMKIADFGLTKFHTKRSRTVEAHGGTTPAPTYMAPELELGVQGGYRSRKSDIWSLGCVFSQFISWAVLGVQSVKDFDERRLAELNVDHRKTKDTKMVFDTFYKTEHFRSNDVTTSLKETVDAVSNPPP